MSDHALIPIGHNKVKVPPHIFAIFPFVLSFIKVKRFHFHHFLDLEKVSLHPIQPLTSMILLMTLKLVKSHSLTIICFLLTDPIFATDSSVQFCILYVLGMTQFVSFTTTLSTFLAKSNFPCLQNIVLQPFLSHWLPFAVYPICLASSFIFNYLS